MIPRKQHLEQINRFHDLIEKIDNEIEIMDDENIKLDLLVQYYKLSKLWNDVDNKIEEIKYELDTLENI